MPDSGLTLLYQRRVREWAVRVRNDRRLADPDISVTRVSRTCGSAVTLDVRRRGDLIVELGWRARACTLGMASTAIVVRHACGRTFSEIEETSRDLRRVLAGEDAAFIEPWGDLEIFRAAQPFASRHSSILLPFDALGDIRTR